MLHYSQDYHLPGANNTNYAFIQNVHNYTSLTANTKYPVHINIPAVTTSQSRVLQVYMGTRRLSYTTANVLPNPVLHTFSITNSSGVTRLSGWWYSYWTAFNPTDGNMTVAMLETQILPNDVNATISFVFTQDTDYANSPGGIIINNVGTPDDNFGNTMIGISTVLNKEVLTTRRGQVLTSFVHVSPPGLTKTFNGMVKLYDSGFMGVAANTVSVDDDAANNNVNLVLSSTATIGAWGVWKFSQ